MPNKIKKKCSTMNVTKQNKQGDLRRMHRWYREKKYFPKRKKKNTMQTPTKLPMLADSAKKKQKAQVKVNRASILFNYLRKNFSLKYFTHSRILATPTFARK